MRTSLVTLRMANWMLRRSDSRRSSRSFSGPGQTPGISSSLVFFDASMRRGIAWRPRTAIRSFGPRRFISFRPVLSLKDALGGQYTWASWLQHPLSGFGLHFFLKAFELGKLTGNYLVEFNQKPKVYSDGYRSPWEKYLQRFPGGLAVMLEELTTAEKMEFRPLVPEIGFPRPTPDDPRARKPKADEADYAEKLEKLKAHNAFLMEGSCITRHSQDIELRKKYRIVSAEGYPLYDSTLREAFTTLHTYWPAWSGLSTEGQDKDFIKSAFARKPKSDLVAYESLKAKREAELEELYKRPFEDIAVEEFLDQLPKPQIEEVEEPVPLDTAEAPQENATSSAVDAEAGDLPQGKMPDPAEATTPDVPMETEAPALSAGRGIWGEGRASRKLSTWRGIGNR